MANQKSKLMVGLFMTCGSIIALVALIWLGMTKYFEEGRYYATYFDQSVQGLSIDSPVKYRGVSVGRVDQIKVAPDAKLIMVVMVIESGLPTDQEVVAQLKVVGITGAMFIELDRANDADLKGTPQLEFNSPFPIIASKPSEISRLLGGIDDVLQKFAAFDLPGIADRTKTALDNINETAEGIDLAPILKELHTTLVSFNKQFDSKRWERIASDVDTAATSFSDTMAEARTTFSTANLVIDELRGMVADNRGEVDGAISDLRTTLQKSDQFLTKATELTDRASNFTDRAILLSDEASGSLADLQDQLERVLLNLSSATDAMDRSMTQISSNPSQLIFGSSPKERDLPGENQ